MDCDFYTIYTVLFKYKDGESVNQYSYAFEDTRSKHYWTYPLRDEDFETDEEYQLRCKLMNHTQMADTLKQYPIKFLYKNDTWLCIETAKQRYLELAAEKGISPESLIDVYKEMQIMLE